jgi:hypothetical protein
VACPNLLGYHPPRKPFNQKGFCTQIALFKTKSVADSLAIAEQRPSRPHDEMPALPIQLTPPPQPISFAG